MDGTLNRIELFIIPTYKEVLRKFADTEVDDDTVLSLMGCVDEDIYQGLLPGAPMERFEEFMKLTVEAEFRNIDLYHGAFDGVPEMIVSSTKKATSWRSAPTAPTAMPERSCRRWRSPPILPGCRAPSRDAPSPRPSKWSWTASAPIKR